jgi:hypothetical protein
LTSEILAFGDKALFDYASDGSRCAARPISPPNRAQMDEQILINQPTETNFGAAISSGIPNLIEIPISSE